MTQVAICTNATDPLKKDAPNENETKLNKTVVSGQDYYYYIWKTNHGPLTTNDENRFLSFKLIVRGLQTDEEFTQYIKYFIDDSLLRRELNNIMFAVVSSGASHCVVPRDLIADFIVAHSSYCFICQHAAFDFHLVRILLSDIDRKDALEWWWEAANECRMRDIHLLDILVRLALDDKYTIERELEVIVEETTQLRLSSDRYKYGRRHYEESTAYRYMSAMNKPAVHEDVELTELAIRDAIVILKAYERLFHLAVELMELNRNEMFTNALEAYGPLSEGIQVKGAIVLADITRNGMSIDMTRVDKVRQKLEQRMMTAVNKLMANPKYSGLFDLTVKDGQIVPQREGDKPSVVLKRLEELLQEAAQEIREIYNIPVTIPEKITPSGKKVSLSTKIWQEYADYNEFIRTWIDMEQAAHYIAFLSHLQSDRAHPEYSVIKRNGRTSAHNPPIQQTPRKGGFREIFRATPGHILVALDYDFIELCTLAAVCKARYGFSVLADVIIQGIDPHCFTAAMIEGVPLTELMTWKDSSDSTTKKKFQTLRQQAKAINFGIPSGLTANGLGVYAQQAYGVTLESEDAEKFRTMLIEQVYPELSHYLRESEMDTLAENLGVDVDTCWRKFSWKKKRSPAVSGGIRNVVRGNAVRKKDSKPYNAYFVKKVWTGLLEVCRDAELYRTLSSHVAQGSQQQQQQPSSSSQKQQQQQIGNEELFKRLFGRATVTLTGRIRGRVGFTQACNTPFSGLAADGAKLAMWNLMQVGYKLVGFIHDEILLEIPESSDWNKEAKLIEEIVCQAMQELTGAIPITVSIALTRVWSKQAKAVYNKDNELLVWEPDHDELNE